MFELYQYESEEIVLTLDECEDHLPKQRGRERVGAGQRGQGIYISAVDRMVV